eukprot:3674634-Amphidinium_carterae.1
MQGVQGEVAWNFEPSQMLKGGNTEHTLAKGGQARGVCKRQLKTPLVLAQVMHAVGKGMEKGLAHIVCVARHRLAHLVCAASQGRAHFACAVAH